MPTIRHPYSIVEDLENALCEYTGAPQCVVVSSCTIAIEMVCAYLRVQEVSIPKHTYVSVPQSIVKAGGTVRFDDRTWSGSYSLDPYPVFDSAPRFTKNMYGRRIIEGYECISFHRRKIFGHTEGGAILCSGEASARELRILRHDGREAGRPEAFTIGYHAVMSPGVAAELLAKLPHLAPYNDDMPDDNYPDLSLVDWNDIYRRQRERPSALDNLSKGKDRILKDIGVFRAQNKKYYEEMSTLILGFPQGADHTLALVSAIYRARNERGMMLHKRIVENDAAILLLSRKLCANG